MRLNAWQPRQHGYGHPKHTAVLGALKAAHILFELDPATQPILVGRRIAKVGQYLALSRYHGADAEQGARTVAYRHAHRAHQASRRSRG